MGKLFTLPVEFMGEANTDDDEQEEAEDEEVEEEEVEEEEEAEVGSACLILIIG